MTGGLPLRLTSATRAKVSWRRVRRRRTLHHPLLSWSVVGSRQDTIIVRSSGVIAGAWREHAGHETCKVGVGARLHRRYPLHGICFSLFFFFEVQVVLVAVLFFTPFRRAATTITLTCEVWSSRSGRAAGGVMLISWRVRCAHAHLVFLRPRFGRATTITLACKV